MKKQCGNLSCYGLLYLIFCVLLPWNPAFASNPPLYDDPRIQAWSRQYLEGKAEAVLSDVEQDLLSPNPHPFSSQVWVNIHWREDRLEQAWSNATPALRKALGPLAEIEILSRQRRYAELFSRWPSEKAGEIRDVWSLFRLEEAAGTAGRYDDQVAYLMAAAQRFPGYFQTAWRLTYLNDYQRDQVRRLLQENAALRDTPFGQYMSAYLNTRPWGHLDQLAAVEQWLAQNPNDGRALTAKAAVLKELDHRAEATRLEFQGFEAFPFYSNWPSLITSYVREDRFDEAKIQIERIFRAFYKNPEVRIPQGLAEVLRDAGEKGKAREVLEPALAHWPNDPALLHELARLELDSKRPAEAVDPARRAAASVPDNLEYQLTWLQALTDAGKAESAWQAFVTLKQRIAFKSPDFWHRGAAILDRLGRQEERLALIQAALAEFPVSWMQRLYAQALWTAGHKEQALVVLDQALVADPNDKWAINSLAEYTEAVQGKESATQVLERWSERYPWQEQFWVVREQRLSGSDLAEQKVRLWRHAIAGNPDAFWPWEKLVRLYTDAKQWEQAQRTANEAFTALAQGDHSARIERFRLKALPVAAQTSAVRLDPAEVDQALADLEQYAQQGGDHWYYHRSVYQLLLTKGASAKQAVTQHALEWVKRDPSNYDILTRDPINNGAKAFYWGHRYVEREPFDGERLRLLALYHVRWGGSPLVGLRLIDRIKRNGLQPASSYASIEGDAYQNLGDPRLDFENYRSYTGISESDRYIGWYERTRTEILSRNTKRITLHLDREPLEAEILLPNGEVMRRADHPITGKMLFLAKGPAYVRAEYDASGENLLKMSSSSGEEIHLEYNEANEISFMSTTDQNLAFEYNTRGKPIRITMENVGTIVVAYDDQDEITSVQALTPSGDEAKDESEITLKVTSAFQKLTHLAELFKAAYANIPYLPFNDPQLDQLKQDYATHRSAETSAETVVAKQSALNLARYLIDHLQDAAEYGQQARELLQDLFAVDELRKTSLEDRLQSGEAVQLWHRLMRFTKPKGIPGDDFQEWGRLREWLRSQVATGDHPQFAQWFEAIDNTPLQLLPDAQWLPGNDLNNSGFWRRFSRAEAEILPKAHVQKPLRAVLVRGNGDTVVGSEAGLSVLRSGFWKWFGFDDNLKRFSENLSSGSITVSSEVLALAETDNGTLWVGTAKGLIAIPGDYPAEIRRWQTTEEGLVSPRIERLATSGETVWIGTPQGLFYMNAHTERPAPVDTATGTINQLVVALNPGTLDVATLSGLTKTIQSALTGEETDAIQAVLQTDKDLHQQAAEILKVLTNPAVTEERLHELRLAGQRQLTELANKALCLSDRYVWDQVTNDRQALSRQEYQQAETTYETTDDGPALATALLHMIENSALNLEQTRNQRLNLIAELRTWATQECAAEPESTLPACPSDNDVYEKVSTAPLLYAAEEQEQIEQAYSETDDGRELANKLASILQANMEPALANAVTVQTTRQQLVDFLKTVMVTADCVALTTIDAIFRDLPLRTEEQEKINQMRENKKMEIASLITAVIPTPAAAQAILERRREIAQQIRAQLDSHFLLVGRPNGVAVIQDGLLTTVTNDSVDGIAWSAETRQIFLLRKDQLSAIAWPPTQAGPVVSQSLPDQQNLRFEKRIYGITMLQIPDGGEALAVLTDQGLSMYRDWHFEHFSLPLIHQRAGMTVGPEILSQRNQNLYLVTHEAIYGFERGAALRFGPERVYDLAVADALGMTFIAQGSQLAYIDHQKLNDGPQLFAHISATHLALDSAGRLIANDGHNIVRFDAGSSTPQVLFSAKAKIDTNGWQGPVRNILIDRNGAIWVAAGSSVFRWQDGETQEFNYLVDATKAPFRSSMISRIIETVDGKIWVVASDEGHLAHAGVSLKGGLFEWNGSTFSKLDLKDGSSWFMTGYTAINERTAVVGTVGGFARHQPSSANYLESYNGIGDVTYNRLREQHPMLWLGRDGAKLGENSWLFPSADGLVLYHQGSWLYPSRLNQMLPDDQSIGQWGGRTVHAVAVDAAGRIYAGTDRGLLVYTGGGDAASLLVNNGMSDLAFTDLAVNREKQLRDVLLDKIDKNSEGGRVLAQLEQVNQEIAELDQAQSGPPQLQPGASQHTDAADEKHKEREDRAEALRKRLQSRERARNRILAQLENDHYGLYQMMRLDPRELAARHQDLESGQAVIQYLPTPEKLYIQMVTREGAQLREVSVSAKDLDERTLSVAHQLRVQASLLAGKKPARGLLVYLQERTLPDINQQLAWLYSVLLRPVERDLENMKHVFIVPVGTLTYVPFSALLRATEPQPEYAVERFRIGILNSLYHLDLVLKHRKSYMDQTLLVGDPDGSLPGARLEVETLAKEFPNAMEPLIGNKATFDALIERLPNARVVHLATHGILDKDQPDRSYLQLADGYRLDVVDISTMSLTETDLAVLSACESGIGKDGLEYATLARAFAHARVPTVVASLWPVDDEATKRLMVEFHRLLDKGIDVFRALADAQRQVLKQGAPYDNPAAWAAFVPFGKP